MCVLCCVFDNTNTLSTLSHALSVQSSTSALNRRKVGQINEAKGPFSMCGTGLGHTGPQGVGGITVFGRELSWFPFPPSCPAGPEVLPGCFWFMERAPRKWQPGAMGVVVIERNAGATGNKERWNSKKWFLHFSALPVP